MIFTLIHPIQVNHVTSGSDYHFKHQVQSNITIKAQYVSSKRNSVADSISRSQWGRFRDLEPDADVWPTPAHSKIWQI